MLELKGERCPECNGLLKYHITATVPPKHQKICQRCDKITNEVQQKPNMVME